MEPKERKTDGLLLPLVVAAGILVIAALALAASHAGGGRKDTTAAVAMLQTMEAGDPDEVQSVLREQEKARLEAERETIKARLLNGEIDVWSLLHDYVIIGDSRPAGFTVYGMLPEERVIFGAGDTIREMRERMSEIEALDPAYAYISYGINDINIGYWDTPEEYVAEFGQILDEMHAAMPDTEIYINSILPVQQWAESKGAKWPEAPIYNEALRQMCAEHDCTYIDNDAICAEHQDLYDSDGIHFQQPFYDYWAMNLVLATLENGEETIS